LNTQYRKNYNRRVNWIFSSNSYWLCYTQKRWWLWWVSFTTTPLFIVLL